MVSLEDENNENCATSSSKVQPTLDVLVKSTIATKAEIMWALKCISSGFSNNVCVNINSMFKTMFPDSHIATGFSMSSLKVSYIINHGLAPHFKQILKDGVGKSDCYVVSFDESLNDITQTCQMDILIRYWDINDNVKVRYWRYSFLGHSTHSDLLKHFNESLSGLDSMDGPAVNWKFFGTLTTLTTVNVNNYHS